MLATNQIMNQITLPVLLSFAISVILCPIVIPFLHKLKFGQFVREEGPQSHLKKAGTPTMGGLIFLLSLVLNKVIDNSVIVYVISALSFFLISSFVIPFKYIPYVYLFNKYFEDDFSRLFEDIIKEQ